MNTVLKCIWSKKSTHKKKIDRKMGPKCNNTCAVNQPAIKMALLVAIIALTVSVIYLYKETINGFTIKTLNLDLNKLVADNYNDRKTSKDHKAIKDKIPAAPVTTGPVESVHQIRQKAIPKPSDMKSCVQFLTDIQSLTLDDFQPIDNQNAEDLQLSQISSFNNLQLGPRLQSIVRMDYFKFVKLNLNRGCTLWSDTSKCALRDCSIQYCDESQLPKSLIMGEKSDSVEDCPTESEQKLSEIDRTVPSTNIEAMNTLFDCTEDDSEGAQYYDLLRNPERFTGYSGESCDRIWRSIYDENCFLQKQRNNPFSLDSFCYEERIFYRAISGLHSSINIHLSALYHQIDGSFSHNTKEFVTRFNGQTDYLRNLYFVYLLELRALHKCEPYLLNKVNWQSSGDQSLTKEAIKDLLRTVKKFKFHFNESILFKQQPPNVAQEVSEHFHNITTNIMDCVGCDRCRLWGKVQTHGLSTALKILLTDDMDKLRLHRHEITCLVNAMARLSNSIAQLDKFKQLLTNN